MIDIWVKELGDEPRVFDAGFKSLAEAKGRVRDEMFNLSEDSLIWFTFSKGPVLLYQIENGRLAYIKNYNTRSKKDLYDILALIEEHGSLGLTSLEWNKLQREVN